MQLLAAELSGACRVQDAGGRAQTVAASSFGGAAPSLDLRVAADRCDLGFNVGS